jgi:hypothetical protein
VGTRWCQYRQGRSRPSDSRCVEPLRETGSSSPDDRTPTTARSEIRLGPGARCFVPGSQIDDKSPTHSANTAAERFPDFGVSGRLTGYPESAGINRHVIEDARALQGRKSSAATLGSHGFAAVRHRAGKTRLSPFSIRKCDEWARTDPCDSRRAALCMALRRRSACYCH